MPSVSETKEVNLMVADLEKRIGEKKGNVRRIVTGHRNGKSVIVDDSEIPAQPFLGFELNELWETIGVPTIPVKEEDYRKGLSMHMPDAGAIRVRLALLPPDEKFFKAAKERGTDPVEDWRKAFGDDFRMHTTDTIDCGIILSGDLSMQLDDGVEVLLKPGDVVVNCGTRHAWRNRSSENCIGLFVCIGAKRDH
jgi:mannose-6-phosphate isomerase-like protein (cupin superfamily)